MIREVTQALSAKKKQHDHGVSLKVAKAIFGVGSSELAREFAVTAPAIDKWTRTRTFNRDRLDALAQFFGMSTEAFESLSSRALSESVNSDAEALLNHLKENNMAHGKEAQQIQRFYNKIVDLLVQIEAKQ